MLDVEALIVEWVYRSSQSGEIDSKTLKACSLGNFRLRTYVTSVRIFIKSGEDEWDLDVPSPNKKGIALLTSCPNVTSIAFCDPMCSDPWQAEVERRLRAINLRPLQIEAYGQVYLVARMLAVFPSVRSIKAHVEDCDDPHDDLPPIILPCNVFLSWDSWNWDRELAENVTWMLSPWNKDDALRSITLNGPARSAASDGPLPPPPPPILALFSHMEELVFSELPEVPTSLPTSVRHIGVHLDRNPGPGGSQAVEQLLQAILALPHLRLLTASSAWPTEYLEIVRIWSRRRFEFIVYSQLVFGQKPACQGCLKLTRAPL
ncbi:hypothetical protein FA95DRAFT_1577254 [Auriscalpium vulgare]|uniref:Uncharacterized protein n=1 Tax=Auriscalpium vulgare TaxID=40419 RepID=A0ACB8R8T1_9AGAM|nr:hypothetical protein FA95DRAFT_1577254 [Auriscalpium vulgare]